MIDDLVYGKVTDKGVVRSENQDCCDVYVASDKSDAARRGSLFVVCDGMGGHNGGSIASTTAVSAAIDAWTRLDGAGVRKRLALSIDAGNAAVRSTAASNVALRNMGTTLVAFAVRGDRGQVAHIGDSRCYLFRDGKAEQLTRDHTYLNDLIEIGLLTPEKAKNHPERNIITRCIGMGDPLQVDFKTVQLKNGDRFLLCSDGLYNYVEADEMLKEVLAASPAEAAARLVALANARGGEDNITCLIVHVARAEHLPEIAEDEAALNAPPPPATTVVSPDPNAATPVSPVATSTATAATGLDTGRELTRLESTEALEPRPKRRRARLAWAVLIAAELALIVWLLKALDVF
jgi:PPM family protein phosphatase